MRIPSPLVCLLLVASPCLAQTSIDLAPSKTINAALEQGSDIGQKVNAAAAQLPMGGRVYIPASSTCYQYSTPIVIGSPIILAGDGPGTCLEYTGTTGVALTMLGSPGPSVIAGSSGTVIRDFTLQTPAAAKGSVDGTTGIFLNQISGIDAYNVNIAGFGTGLLFGSYTFIVHWHSGIFRHNAIALNYPPGIKTAGENLTFSHTTFNDGTQTDGVSWGMNCVMIDVTPASNSSEFNFENNSFDGCQVVIGENWESSTRFINPHFEDVQHDLNYPFLKITTGTDRKSNVVLTNPNFMIDATGVLPDALIELGNNGSLDITNGTAQGWGGLSAPNTWISIKGPGTAHLSTRGNFYFVHTAGQIPLYKTDGINQPQIDVPRTSNRLSTPITTDGDVVLAQGDINGDYWIAWRSTNARDQVVKVSVSTSNYSSQAAVNVISNQAFAGNVVLSGIRAVFSNGTPQLVANVGNRDGTSGPLSIQWSGDGIDQPQILPGSAVGTTSVMSYGLQQAADGSTGIAGGMKLLPSVQSACDSSKGGLFWYVQGFGGSSDTVQICMRDSTGSYAWHALSVGSALSPPASGGGTWDHSTPAEIPVHGVPILPSQPMN